MRMRNEKHRPLSRRCTGIISLILAMFVLCLPAAAAAGVSVASHTQEEIRQYISADGASISDGITFEETPVLTAPYDPGKLSEATLQSAVTILNRMRYIAGLSYDVTLDETYSGQVQAGCLVDAVNKELTHTPAQPEGMSDELYKLGYTGTTHSNLGWGYTTLGSDIVSGWLYDGTSSNIATLGHRRWVLNPPMGKTGFGYVSSYSGMYAFDESGSGKEDGVVWPAQVMPMEYFGTSYPWSYSCDKTLSKDQVSVVLKRSSDGKEWNFSSTSADGYFNVNNDGYGQSNCVIFRPNDISAYQSDDVFQVTIKNGSSVVADYTVTFFSLNPVTSLTLSAETVSLDEIGASKTVSASIEPSGASTSYVWTSSDESVAAVSASGSSAKITAVGYGKATITVQTTNGHVEASCEVIVHHFEEVGLTADGTQMEYHCLVCGDSVYKTAITSIPYVYWRVSSSSDSYYYTKIPTITADGSSLSVLVDVTPTTNDDSVVVTTDRPDILTFERITNSTRQRFDGIPKRAGKVTVTFASKFNPAVSSSYTLTIGGDLAADDLTAYTQADTSDGSAAVCMVPVELSVEAAGGTAPYSYTFTAVKDDGKSFTIAEQTTKASAVWKPEAAGIYQLKVSITDAAGTMVEKTLDNFTVRKAKVTESAGSSVALADADSSLVYGMQLSSIALNTASAVFTGESDETVSGKLAWTEASVLNAAGAQSLAWTFTPENKEAYESCSCTLALTVEKAQPVVTADLDSPLPAYYVSTRTLADMGLTGTAAIQYNGQATSIKGSFVWDEADLVPTAGKHAYGFRFIPEDSANIASYEGTYEITLDKGSLTVKSTDGVTVPELTYGDKLSDHSANLFKVYAAENTLTPLEGTYVWSEPDAQPAVADSGKTLYEVVFTPNNENYEPYSRDVYVTVQRAQISERPESASVSYETAVPGSYALPEGWLMSEDDAAKELPVGEAVTVKTYYQDQDNYANPIQMIELTRQACVHPDTAVRTPQEATCTVDGLQETYCTVCEDILQSTILPAGHTPVTDEAVQATCTETGLTEGSHCSVCDETLVAQKVTEALGHSYTSQVTKEATCGAAGERLYTCQICGNQYTEVIEATGQHTAVVDEAVEATCTKSGLTEGSHCAVCGEIFTAQEVIEALGHSYTSQVTKEATCGAAGERRYTCQTCGDQYTEDIAATGQHTAVVDKAVAATCSTTGLTEGKHCNVCGKVLTAQSVVKALGHTYSAQVTKAATCSTNGEKLYTCTRCGNQYKEAIAATGQHTAVVDKAVAATCSTTGLTEGKHCSVCGKVLTAQSVIKALGHSYTAQVTKKAACTTAGEKLYTCTRCGDQYKEVIAATGHTVVKDPAVKATTSSEGKTEGSHCSVCGQVIAAQQTIAKLQQETSVPQTNSNTASERTESLPSQQVVDQQITTRKSDADLAGSSFNLLQAKASKVTKSSIKLTWKKVTGASVYTVYGNKCGKNNQYIKIADVKGTSYTAKKLAKGTYYKYMIVAGSAGKTIAISKTIHAATSGKKVGNYTKVKVAKKTITLKAGKTAAVKAKAKAGKLKVKKHRGIAYESSNEAVASVSKAGKIKALKKGTCYVYAYAQNGVYAKVKVVVK